MAINSLKDQEVAFKYVKELWPNLVIDEGNYKMIRGWIVAYAGSDFTPNNLTVCIKELWPKLNKQAPVVAPVPAPEAPQTEVLRTLKDGTQQLPLSASELTVRKASLEQVRDLTRRRFAAEGSSTLFPTPSLSRPQGDY